MKTKRILGILAACTMVVGFFSGCGAANNSAGNANTTKSDTQTSQQESSDSTQADTSTDGGKILVAYYSATGSTKAVAETLADTLDADLFEITPVEPYTSDDLRWSNSDSRVAKEHDDESLRDVELTQTTPDAWDSYDTVLIGYPIWWGIAAWPVNHFVEDNDFTGKTVIPFCTSASSGLGRSGDLLEEMAGSGNWQEGQRFSSGASDADVQSWVEELGLTK